MSPEIEVGVSTVAVDAARIGLIMEESLQNHSSLMHTSRANEQSAHNVARHSAVRKFDKEDPIEAACVETILRLTK